jgi:hypothetical protein
VKGLAAGENFSSSNGLPKSFIEEKPKKNKCEIFPGSSKSENGGRGQLRKGRERANNNTRKKDDFPQSERGRQFRLPLKIQ